MSTTKDWSAVDSDRRTVAKVTVNTTKTVRMAFLKVREVTSDFNANGAIELNLAGVRYSCELIFNDDDGQL